jgi:thiol:disulfide interchange protein
MKITAVSSPALALLLFATPAGSEPAPRLHARTLEQLAPLPLPYDERANAGAALAAARARAKAANRLLLIDFGGNWCADCRVLAGVMQQPEMRPFLRRHYEVLDVDVGLFDRNMDLIKHYGFEQVRGVPAVFIVNPTTDQLLNRKSIIALADARSMTPQSIADWLARWTK